MNVTKKLNKWQSAGLISQEQVLKITDYEIQNTKPYLMYGLIFLSMFFIGMGTISLIAANWYAIPAFIKLIFDFILLAGCACGVYYTYSKEKRLYFEASLFLFSLLCLATIGLIAQIYQIQSDGPAAFLLWSSLMLPLMVYSKKMIFPMIVAATFIGSSLYYLDDYLDKLFNVWQCGLYVAFSLVLLLSYQTITLFLPNKATGFCKALKFCLIFFLIVGVYVTDFNDEFLYNTEYIAGYKFYVLISVTLCLLGISYFFGYLNKNNFISPIIISIILAGTFVPFGALISLSALATLSYQAYTQKQVKLLNFAIFMIGLRVFILYTNIFVGLMTTGFGFIISGIVLLLLVLGWKKAAKYFQRRFKNEN